MNTQRPLTVTIAVVLHALLGLAAILITIPEMTGAVSPDEGPPMFIVVTSLVIGILSLVSAWGAWQGKKWGQVSTIVLRALDGLSAAPGIVFAPTMVLSITATASVILAIVVIWLLLMPVSRRMYA
jgi:uncharacterized membrane protein (DUF2068 family)